MRQSSRAVRQASAPDRTFVADRAIAFLRQIYPIKTAENVAADIGVSADTLAKMIERGSTPSAATFCRLILAYGPAFLAAVFPRQPRWLTEAYQREQLAALEEEQARIQSRIQALKAQP